jgi:hypothetical protein
MKFRTIDVFPESFGNSSLGRVQSVIQICFKEAQTTVRQYFHRKPENKKEICERVTEDEAIERRSRIDKGLTAGIHGLRKREWRSDARELIIRVGRKWTGFEMVERTGIYRRGRERERGRDVDG